MFKFTRYTTGDIHRQCIWVSKRFSVSLHKIVYRKWNADEYPHDHGVDFLSIVFWGGYTEELFKDKYAQFENGEMKRRGLFSWHIMRDTSSHKVISVHPRKTARTLFITWNYKPGRTAYVYTPEGPINAADYYYKLAKDKILEKENRINTKPDSIKNNKHIVDGIN